MKRFEFRLETARRLRERQVEVEETALLGLFGELHGIEESQLQLERLREEEEQAVLTASGVVSDTLAELDHYLRWVRRQRQILAGNLADCQRRIAVQRQRLVAARQKHQAIEKLKERAHRTWQTEFDRELEATAQEVFLAQWHRQPTGMVN